MSVSDRSICCSNTNGTDAIRKPSMCRERLDVGGWGESGVGGLGEWWGGGRGMECVWHDTVLHNTMAPQRRQNPYTESVTPLCVTAPDGFVGDVSAFGVREMGG